MKNKNIVIVGIQPWDIAIGSNCKNIALEFAKNNRVLYVNPPMDRITRYKNSHDAAVQKRIKIAKGEKPALEKIQDNLWNLYPKNLVESINWISAKSVYQFLNKRNAKLFASNINSAIKTLGFEDIILFNDSSMFLGQYLKELLNPELYTYYVRDNLVKVPYWQKHGAFLEPKLIEQADVVVNNSEYYVAYTAAFNKNSVMVGQGCDVSMFDDTLDQIEVAPEFDSLQGPVIGYVGSLTTLRLDIDLLVRIAKQRTTWQIVLVGPEDENFKTSELHDLPNVHFFGNKPMERLPSYIKGFDVAINPQIINDITIGNYPRKIDEYLAMGKPVVATYTKAMEMFKDYVYLAKSQEYYIEELEQALNENTKALRKGRIAFANTHTWTQSVAKIYTAMNNTLKNIA